MLKNSTTLPIDDEKLINHRPDLANGLVLTEFKPEYNRYGRGAPLKRNIRIIEYADVVLAFWDGKSKGTKFVIDACAERKIPVTVLRLSEPSAFFT